MKNYLEKAIANIGNLNRLKKVMKRGEAGEKLTIGYLGGSITMGSVATVQEKCYAYLSHLWWKENFPQAEISFCNAGIGATTSQFGVARIEEDLFFCRPDVVFIEFSVNDDDTAHFRETYEGLVRRALSAAWEPAVILLHNAFYHDGVSAARIHYEVGGYYRLPSISFRDSVMQRCLDGELAVEEVSPDNLHPNDAGHALLAEAVKYFLDEVKKNVDVEDIEYVIPETSLTQNRYEGSVRLRNDKLEILAGAGYRKDLAVQPHITDIFKNGFMLSGEGAYLEFEVEATTLAIQYRRTIQHPAPAMRVLVDGEEMAVLDGEFDETWGDLIALTTIFENEEAAMHKVKLELFRTSEEDKLPFYLVSVITS